MHTRVLQRVFDLLGVVLLGTMMHASGAAVTGPAYTKTNLVSFLAHWKQSPSGVGTACELEPQWVGTVRRVYLRDNKKVYKEDEPRNIRFSHLMISTRGNERTNLILVRGRITRQRTLGSSGAAPVFMSNLPSAQVVATATKLDELRQMFGPQHGWTDGWGTGNGRMHWTEGWTWFTTEAADRVRHLEVFAHVSSASRNEPADIDILCVHEGLFRPADPNSTAERAQFKTGEEVHAEYEADRANARAKYPLPLRSLVEAGETPDDSDLSAYKRALNEVRRNPSPELFRQFAEWIHEGTRQIAGMLDNILLDDHLKLDAWEESKRQIALRALTDALPHAKTNLELDRLILLLLQAHGGGELNLTVEGTSARVNLKAQKLPDGTGWSHSMGSQNISRENLARVAEQCRQALRQRYPGL